MPVVNLPGYFGSFAPNNFGESGKRLNVNVQVFEGAPATVMASMNAFLVSLPSTITAQPIILGIATSARTTGDISMTILYGWYS